MLFYIRLIALTAGALVYLFLLALILGHRRPRLFERLLFFLVLSLFAIYAGGLLEINGQLQYASPPAATRLFYQALIALGVLFVLPLAVRDDRSYPYLPGTRRISRGSCSPVWAFFRVCDHCSDF
jgi:hypothetical protein